jgi:hypothetical protein
LNGENYGGKTPFVCKGAVVDVEIMPPRRYWWWPIKVDQQAIHEKAPTRRWRRHFFSRDQTRWVVRYDKLLERRTKDRGRFIRTRRRGSVSIAPLLPLLWMPLRLGSPVAFGMKKQVTFARFPSRDDHHKSLIERKRPWWWWAIDCGRIRWTRPVTI